MCCIKKLKILFSYPIINLKGAFSNRPSDCAKILHACADRDEISSHLKKIAPTPPQSTTKPILIEGCQPSVAKSAVRRPKACTNQLCACFSSLRSLTSLLGEMLRYQHQRIVTTTKVYIASNILSRMPNSTTTGSAVRVVYIAGRSCRKIGVSVCRRGQIR